jgi:ABC-type multidrug transport system fused ATPase/permease subunit
MRRRRGHLAANLGEKVLAAGAIQQFGQTLRERQRVRRQGRRLAHAAVQRATSAAVLRSLSDITLPLTAAGIVVISNVTSSENGAGAHLGAGGWTATLFLLGMLQGSLRDLALACTHRLAFEQGRARLEEVMTAPIPKDSFVARDLVGDGPLEIAFEDVHAGNTLSGFDGNVRPGDSVAIQGPSGSGKSTVLALAARLRDAEAGLVCLAGHPVSHWTIASIRRAVMLVAPDVPLLASTVIDNIEYGSGPLAERQRAELLRLTGISAAVAALPDGLETHVAEGGRNLPEGLCARIRLARALACSPRLLLVDDPVFSSDGDARAALTRVIATRRATVLIAAPSRALGIRTDRAWRIEGGRLAELTPGAKVIRLSQAL